MKGKKLGLQERLEAGPKKLAKDIEALSDPLSDLQKTILMATSGVASIPQLFNDAFNDIKRFQLNFEKALQPIEEADKKKFLERVQRFGLDASDEKRGSDRFRLFYNLAKELQIEGVDDFTSQQSLYDAIEEKFQAIAHAEQFRRQAKAMAGQGNQRENTNDVYPWSGSYARDSFIWDNITSTKAAEVEVAAKKQNFPAIEAKQWKEIALRWAVFHGFEKTRNFQGERTITEQQRERVNVAIAKARKKSVEQ